MEETISSLGFASRAKKISNTVKVNEIVDDQTQIKKLKQEITQLKKIVATTDGTGESLDKEKMKEVCICFVSCFVSKSQLAQRETDCRSSRPLTHVDALSPA